MLGYQFIHIESYGRTSSKDGKRQNTQNVAAEAERKPHACNHINEPKSHVNLYGLPPCKAVKLAEERAEMARDKIGRRLRKDAQIIVAGVASYPVPIAQLTPSDPGLRKWLKLTHQFLLEKYGDNYKGLYFHHDEMMPHVHFMLIPDVDPINGQMRIDQIHDGVKARNNVTTNRAKDKVRAYKQAMMAFQVDYHEKVGKPCGLCKEGPKRRRLTRKQWQVERSAAQRQAEAFKNIKLAESSLHASQMKQNELEQCNQEIVKSEAQAKAMHAKAQKECYELVNIKANGDKGIISYLNNQVNKLKGNVSRSIKKIRILKSINKRLSSEVSTIEKENNKLKKQNSELIYQNDLRLKGIKQLKSKFYYVLELAKLGQLKKINEISNNNNNNNNQEYNYDFR